MTDLDLTDLVVVDALSKLDKTVRDASKSMGREEARGLVDLYYRLQEHRLALQNQERSLVAAGKSELVVSHFATQVQTLEKQMQSVLDAWTLSTELGQWCRSVKGVGPVLAASFMAHIDITRAPTVGHVWSFAGLNPTAEWKKGERRPWNADLKVTCWKLGDSFVKTSGGDKPGFYGQIYRERKLLEVARNDAGSFADQAAESLKKRKISDAALKATYEAGRLPAGRLELRARRYAVKLFLAGFHEVAYVEQYDKLPPMPYVLTLPNHTHEVVPPGLPARVRELRAEAGRPTS